MKKRPPNIVHDELDNKALLESLLLKRGKSADEVARMMDVPYNSVMHFARKHFSPEQLAHIPRKRRRFTKQQKLEIVLELTQGRSVAQVSQRYDLNPMQLANWRRAFLGPRRKTKTKRGI